MKKVIAILICLALALSGCAFMLNGMTIVEKQICPTLEMSKQAFVAAGFLQAYPQFASAYAVFDFISKGGCALASQYVAAIKDFDATVPAVKGVGTVKPNIDALRQAVR